MHFSLPSFLPRLAERTMYPALLFWNVGMSAIGDDFQGDEDNDAEGSIYKH